MINLIWAMTEDHLIGKGNLMPWHIKEDLVYFKSRKASNIPKTTPDAINKVVLINEILFSFFIIFSPFYI